MNLKKNSKFKKPLCTPSNTLVVQYLRYLFLMQPVRCSTYIEDKSKSIANRIYSFLIALRTSCLHNFVVKCRTSL